ncbi:MAG TPA: hypothetical protein VK927_09275 [Adhaeribacter sp.]|nr:hypothetical protein [Adhaeribacter sp.]
MNLKTHHDNDKPVSANVLFKGEEGTVTSIRILKDQQLKAHITKVPALLVCVSGKAVFENEKGVKETLSPGDYTNIEPMVSHWVNGVEDSQLLVMK